MEEKENKKTKYLKREGIRTMQKDIAKLQEIKIPKERERVTVVKLEEKVEKKPPIKEVAPPPPPAEGKPPFPPFAVTREIEEERRKAEEIERRAEEMKRKKEEEERRKIEEEKKRIEEEQKRAAEELRRKEEEEKERRNRLEEKKEVLNEKRLQLEKELALIPEKRKPIEEEKSRFLAEIEKIKRGRLTPILTKEEGIEKEKKLIEEEEKKAPFQKREEIEEKRWQIEEKREEVEKEKWAVEEEMIKIQEKIKEVDLRIEELEKKAEKLREEYENVINEEEAINSLEKKINLEKEFKLNEDKRLTFEVKLETLIKKKSETEKVLAEILESEKALEEEIEMLEKKEESTIDLREKREIEKRRREVERKRKETEKEKWQIVKKREEDGQEMEGIQFEVEKFKKRGQELEKKIEEVDTFLGNLKERGVKIEDLISLVRGGRPPSPPFAGARETEAPQPEKKRVSEEIERKKEIPTASPPRPTPLPGLPPVPPPRPTPPPPPPPPPEEIPEIPEIKESPAEIWIPKPPPERPKPSLKILIRGIILAFFLILLSGFLYWFFWVRKPIKEPFIPPVEEVVPPVEEVTKEPEIIIPPALIPVETSKTLEISALEEIPQLLSTFLEKTFPENQFTRILIKDTKKNKILGLKDFFAAFEVKTPDNFSEKLNNDFTLFIFSSQGVNRLGFITKIEEKENLVDLTLSWEPTMEKDTEKLFEVLGKGGPALSSSFKTSSYQEISFRFLTISREDFGICYALFNNYFIFTSSFESIKKTIDLIRAGPIGKSGWSDVYYWV